MGDAIGSHLTAAISGAGEWRRRGGADGDFRSRTADGTERDWEFFFYYWRWRWRWGRSDFGKYYVQDYRSLVRRVIHGCLFFF
jgi:hypothetical protein